MTTVRLERYYSKREIDSPGMHIQHRVITQEQELLVYETVQIDSSLDSIQELLIITTLQDALIIRYNWAESPFVVAN